MVRTYKRKLTHSMPAGGRAYLPGPMMVEEELKERLMTAAHKLRVPRNEIIRRALRAYLKHIEDNNYENDKDRGYNTR